MGIVVAWAVAQNALKENITQGFTQGCYKTIRALQMLQSALCERVVVWLSQLSSALSSALCVCIHCLVPSAWCTVLQLEFRAILRLNE
jgi:hypothetical protein